MDSCKKVSFNTTNLSISHCTTLNFSEDQNIVRDFRNKINQILQGKADTFHQHKLKCKVPLLNYINNQKLCEKIKKKNESQPIDKFDQVKLNEIALRSYKFKSLISKRRLNYRQQSLETQSPSKSQSQREKTQQIKIFNTEWQEYQNIYDLHTLLSPNSLDIEPALDEVQFIKSKILKQQKDFKILNRTFDCNVSQNVEPIKIQTSRIIMDGKQKNQRNRFSFRN